MFRATFRQSFPATVSVASKSFFSSQQRGAGAAFFPRSRLAYSLSATSSWGFLFGVSAATLCAAAYTSSSSSSSSSSAVALCGNKAPDTPEYLIPYYLRDTKSRFVHYASIREKGKSRKMSPADFLAAMLALPDDRYEAMKETEEDSTRAFQSFFRWADADGDGSISYREFAFLANILAYPLRDFRVLFRLFDDGDKGALSPAEFVKMMDSVSDDKMRPKMRSGIIRAMFLPGEFDRFRSGESGPLVRPAARQAEGATEPRMIAEKVPEGAVCTFERFSAVVHTMEMNVAAAEFGLADKDGKGHVTKEEFGAMILGSIHGRHLPFFLVDNMRKLSVGATGKDNQVHLSTYLLLSEMFRRAEEVASALQVYAAAGYAIRAPDLKRALDRCVGLSRPVSQAEAELFVKMFDANSDGDLHMDEFLTMLRAKGSYAGVLPKQREKTNLFSRLAACTSEAVQQSMSTE